MLEEHTIRYKIGAICGEEKFTAEAFLSHQEIKDRFLIWLLRWHTEMLDLSKPYKITIIKTNFLRR